MIEGRDLCLAFGEKTVLRGQELTVPAHGRIALMGPSGCGKTTLLRVLAGLQKPDSGSVRVDAARLAFVFQEPRLLPWRTAAQNVNAVLSDTAATLPEAETWLRRLGLDEAGALYPSELSGGMQQRRPEVLLLDEPFKAMDEALRAQVIETVAAHLDGAAVVLATHSEAEARALDCKIYHYNNGRFEA